MHPSVDLDLDDSESFLIIMKEKILFNFVNFFWGQLDHDHKNRHIKNTLKVRKTQSKENEKNENLLKKIVVFPFFSLLF